MEVLAQIVAVLASAMGATWFICSELGRLRGVVEKHVAVDDLRLSEIKSALDAQLKVNEERFADLSDKVIKLEERRAKRAQKK